MFILHLKIQDIKGLKFVSNCKYSVLRKTLEQLHETLYILSNL
jgi:hypothetical protein